MLRVGDTIFSREVTQTPVGYPNLMVSFKYIQINDIIQTEQVIFSNTCIYVCMQIYIYIYMHVAKVNDKGWS